MFGLAYLALGVGTSASGFRMVVFASGWLGGHGLSIGWHLMLATFALMSLGSLGMGILTVLFGHAHLRPAGAALDTSLQSIGLSSIVTEDSVSWALADSESPEKRARYSLEVSSSRAAAMMEESE